MNKFLITGTPRSRTAWFAALCNTVAADVRCYHEPLKYMTKWQDVYDMWQDGISYTGSLGVSDHSLGFHLKEILHVKKPRTLVIVRDKAEVEQSLKNIGAYTPGYIDLLLERLFDGLGEGETLGVNYESLTDSSFVCQCIKHLLPNYSINLNKVEAMMELNIQASAAEALRIAHRRVHDMPALIGQDVLDELKRRNG